MDDSIASGVSGSVSKSAAISTLVQQLREGVISRTELFDKLTRLHRGEVVAGSAGIEEDIANLALNVTDAGRVQGSGKDLARTE